MKKVMCIILSAVIMLTLFSCGKKESDVIDNLQPIPQKLSVTEKKEKTLTNGNFFVATNGSDDNDGSLEHPFLTIKRAQQAVRELKQKNALPTGGITVCVKSGEYRIDSLIFDEADSGTAECPITYCAYGDGEVILNGGVTLNSSDFEKVSESKKGVFSEDVQSKIVQIDLNKYDLSEEKLGKMRAFGAYNTSEKYDEKGAIFCELFFNDSRMNIARYPNNGEVLKTGKIVDNGDSKETYSNKGTMQNENWEGMKNPRGGTFKVDNTTAKRMKNWSNPSEAWLFGCFKYDWADSTTPVASIDISKKTLTTKYASVYGFVEDASYYVFNVIEELDSAGEWYLDRPTNILYFYPPNDINSATIDFSVTTDDLIQLKNTNFINLSGFTVKGTRGNAITVTGNNNLIENCLIKNVAGNAVEITGNNNIVSCNEITRTGKGGIILTGGDRQTLTAGNNVAENNLIHDWSEIYTTYQAGIALHGVGNRCSNNELYNSPHEAITYTGNDHMIEYNILHDVVLRSNDAGAIYAGRNWTAFGTVIRYNCLYNIGSKGFKSNGIYFDDALSGQTAYGNILVNIPDNAFLIGGGRDINVTNNIIINAGRPISYDDRAIAGITNKGWFTHAVNKDKGLWATLKEMPYQTGVWAEKYPNLAKVTDDFNNLDDINFPANPSNSIIENNIMLDSKSSVGEFAETVNKFSSVKNNATFPLNDTSVFVDMANGDYTLLANSSATGKVEKFDNIPFDNIGRKITYRDNISK